ncbi:uncharacterized protein ZBAI_08678 [Zygosaccharomyces bailii ISA1307]|nr:uncharacterized protein ZBAI_08678 [Zygosaccharomyces bailii ISA1307]
MSLVLQLSLVALLATATLADWQFKTRPDLSVPRLNITIPANENTSSGYIFVAPFSGYADNTNHGPRQAAPYIFTDKGELVWSGFSYFSIWATNFQYGKVNGGDFLFSFEGSHNPAYGHGHGHLTFLNQNYETVKELRAGKHKIIDKHEFHIIDEKTGLIEIYQPVPRDLTKYGASPAQQWVVDAIVQEIDIESGEVLFEWSALDWVSLEESVLPINEGQAGFGFNSSDAWDFFHINSVDKDTEGNYLISARDASALYKLNGTSGEIIWKLGGLPGKTNSSFNSDFTFSFQHHARFLKTEGSKQIISFYDNSAHGSEDKDGNRLSYSNVSSAKIIEVDTHTWKARLINEYLPPDDLLSKSQGSTQVLPNSNVFVNWGSEGAITEFTYDGNPIFHAYLDSGFLGDKVENYRAFKFNWTGIPNEDIAVASESSAKNEIFIYVSWNGDTRTKKWRFYSLEKGGKKNYLDEVEKIGFETQIQLKDVVVEKVVVEAIGNDDLVLGRSDVVRTQPQVLPFRKGKVSRLSDYFEWRDGFRKNFGEKTFQVYNID